MPTAVSLEKTAARERLRGLVPLQLRRPVFFVPGWTDQGCLCWTEPYVEGGADRLPGWEYTIQDWVQAIVAPVDRRKVHFVKLVKDEANLIIERYPTGSRKDKIKTVTWEADPTYHYENFFQFAELLKAKIHATGATAYDLVGHSMGGLDSIAAVLLDRTQDVEPAVQDFIETEPLDGVHRLITVATPFRGSPAARLVKRTQIDEWFRPAWSEGIRKQAEAMAPPPDSVFIDLITQPHRQRRLLQRVPGGVYTMGSRNDPVVPNARRRIKDAHNYPGGRFRLARHSMILGITQDPRLALALFQILGT